MKKAKNMKKIIIVLFLYMGVAAVAQESHSNYQNHSYRYFDRYVYRAEERFHTAVKPFLMQQVDSVVSLDTLYHKPVERKFWDVVLNQHLIAVEKEDYAFSIDPQFQFELGQGQGEEAMSWMNTRGFIINGRVGKKLRFSTSFYENQAMFNDYRYAVVKEDGVVPGQGKPKTFKEGGFDYGFAEGFVSWQLNKFFNLQFGHGKNFIGDGYRSVLLSDHAFNYPYFKITTDFWNIKYVNLWAQFQDLSNSYDYGTQTYDKKWGAIHYLDWSATPWLNIGLFEAIMWEDQDSSGRRGFDMNYANPVIFFRPVEFSVGSPDNVLMGANVKLTLWRKQVFYGQFLIDEFAIEHMKEISSGWWSNKFAIQGGYKGFDLFKVQHLDLQTEVNYARPFTYSHLSTGKNYGHYDAALAHPLGSNFLESVTFLRYNHKRVFVEARYSHAIHGADTAGLNYGNNIWLSYNDRAQDYGNKLGTAERVTLDYTTLTLSYLVNPNYNFNVYASYTNRVESIAGERSAQSLFTFGIRTSLQNFYYDF